MRFTSQHKAINQKEYGKAVSPLRFDSLALILSCSIFVVYGKQSEKKSTFAVQRGILPYTLFGILPTTLVIAGVQPQGSFTIYICVAVLSRHFEGATRGVTGILGGVVALDLGGAVGEVTALGSDRFKLYLMASAW